MISRKFERNHPAVFCQATGVTQRPVALAQVPPEPLERDPYRELLAAIDAPVLSGGPRPREKDVCRSLLRVVSARVIVLDEVNSMLAGTWRTATIFLNAIRFLANDLRVPLGLCRHRSGSAGAADRSAARRTVRGLRIAPLEERPLLRWSPQKPGCHIAAPGAFGS